MRARLNEMWDAARRHRAAMILAGLTLGAFLVRRLFEQQFDAYITTPVWRWLVFLVTQPAGYLGVALFVQLALLLLLAFADTSPVVSWLRARSSRRPAPRSQEEREEVKRLQEMWTHEAREAIEHARHCLNFAIDRVGQVNPLAALLHEKVASLLSAVRELQQSLGADAGVPFAEVLRRLQRVLNLYGLCVGWYNRLRRMDRALVPPDGSGELVRMHRTWAAHHRSWIPEAKRLTRRPAFAALAADVPSDRLSDVQLGGDARFSPEEAALDDWPPST